jgi:flagellar biosynthesis protein FlhG
MAAATLQTEPMMKPLLNGVSQMSASTRMRTIAITSGKGGVGKSNIAVNVALELAVRGHRVSLFDADCALANTDVLLGLNPHYHLGHVLAGQRTLEQVVIEAAHGLRLIPGGSGTEELANLSYEQHARLVSDLQALEQDSDFMIIDTAAGIAANVTGVLRAAMEVVIITTPDPTAVVDAYATIKVLHQHAPSKPIKVVVNDVVGISDADRVFAQLRAVTTRFLNHQIEHLGMIPRDPELADAVREQTPVIEYAPDAPSSRALRLIARRLEKPQQGTFAAEKLAGSFWCSLAGADV